MNVFLSLPQPIHELVIQAVAKDDIEELIMTLKVLGNAGHPGSLKTIMKLLPGFGSASLPLRVHIDAVLALRNMAKREPKMVRLHFPLPSIINKNTVKTSFIYNVHHLCD